MQSLTRMNTNWAAENIQTIRTLMERATIYRRALAPVMTFAGVVGIAAAYAGERMNIHASHAFARYWMVISTIAVAGVGVLVRRQALKDGEAFWSPPTRRVTQALLPAFSGGLLAGVVFWWKVDGVEWTPFLPPIWVLLYGCGLHAAGFFMPRGIRLLAWMFVLGSAGSLLTILGFDLLSPRLSHPLMGGFFGVLQLAYGLYLYLTEQRKSVV